MDVTAFTSRFLLALGLALAAACGQCQPVWLPGGTPTGLTGLVEATAQWDPDGSGPLPMTTVAGGSLFPANVLAWEPTSGTWLAVGAGPLSYVRCLATLASGALVAGHGNAVARLQASTWVAVGNGLPGPVYRIVELPNGDLVAAGAFAPLANVWRWNGASWTPLGPGSPSGAVSALAVRASGELVAAGALDPTGSIAIARWNGAWVPLGGVVQGHVGTVHELPNGTLVAGGSFTHIGVTAASRIAQWNGTSWSAPGGGVGGPVATITHTSAGDLVVAGSFATAGGALASSIAIWNGSSWAPCGSGIVGNVHAVTRTATGDLIAGGSFVGPHSVQSPRIARYDLSAGTWLPFSGSDPGTDGAIFTLLPLPGGDVVAGGTFQWIGGAQATNVARRSGGQWVPLGSGIGGSLDTVHALVRMPNGDLIAGGQFTHAGGTPCARIARWNGTTWSPLGSGTDGPVRALVMLDTGDVVVGGLFGTAGGVAAANVARWNGAGWSPVGSGTNGIVFALAAAPGGGFVAGGAFAQAGSSSCSSIARWTGASWAPLGTGVAGSVWCVRPRANGTLLVAGEFATAGGVTTNSIAAWDGSVWSALGNGLTNSGWHGTVRAVSLHPDGDVLVGGVFDVAGGVVTSGLARWTGGAWSSLAGGVSGSVAAIAITTDDAVTCGGSFWAAGTQPRASVAFLASGCPAAVVTSGAACPSSGGGNTLVAESLPWTGSTFAIAGTGLPTAALVVVVTGFAPLAVPLPSVLPQGQVGCSLWVTPDVLGVATTTTGTLGTSFTLPSTASLAGATFRQQLVPLEFGAGGAFVATTTNAILATVGVF